MARREPAVILAEIAWRWLFASVALLIGLWGGILLLRSVHVTKANELLLRTLNPAIIQYVLRDLLHDKWGVLLRAVLSVGLSLSLLWIVIATLARSATTRVLLEQCDEADTVPVQISATAIRAVGAIQSLRLALIWIGAGAYLVSAFVASEITTVGDQNHPIANALFFLLLYGIAVAILSFFNWILFLAPILAVRDSFSWSVATVKAWQFSRSRAGRLLGLNLAHGAIRVVWFIFMTGVVFMPLAFSDVLPKSVILIAIAFISLAYFAVADALFVTRWAGYIELAEESAPDSQPVPAHSPTTSSQQKFIPFASPDTNSNGPISATNPTS